MKITPDNWGEVERDIRTTGLRYVLYDEQGVARTIITKKGVLYQATAETWKKLIRLGRIMVAPGRRVALEK